MKVTPYVPHRSRIKTVDAFLPYRRIENKMLVSQRPDQLTALWQCTGPQWCSVDTMQWQHDRLTAALCEMKPHCLVSVYLFKLFETVPCTQSAQATADIVQYVNHTYREKQKEGHNPRYTSLIAITWPVEKEKTQMGLFEKWWGRRKEMSDAMDRLKEERRRFNLAIKQLEVTLEYLHRLNDNQIVQALSLILNHTYLHYDKRNINTVFQSDIQTLEGNPFSPHECSYVKYNGLYHAQLSARANEKFGGLPDYADASLNMVFHKPQLKDYEYCIKTTMRLLRKDQGLAIAKRRRGLIATVEGAKKNPFLNLLIKKPQGKSPEVLHKQLDALVKTVSNSRERIIELTYDVQLWDNDEKELEKQCEDVQAVVQEKLRLRREKLNIKPVYLSMLPGNEYRQCIRMTMATFNATDFLPVDLPRIIVNDQNAARNTIIYKNETDSIMHLDIFDKRAKNWNALVFGDSGSGKSFFVQSILWQYMQYNPQVAIIDYGGQEAGSYRNFVLNNRGTYLEMGEDVDFSINPFEGGLYSDAAMQKPRPGKLNLLLATIERMAGGEQEPFSEKVNYHLQQELRDYYCARDNNARNDCDLDDFARSHLKENATFTIECNRDIYKEIWRFLGTNPYARYVKKRKEISNKDLICFDLEGIRREKRLKDVIIPALLDMITNNLFATGSRDRKKLIVMDEAWKDMRGGQMTEFMEGISRTVRKLNGQITIITQSLNDIVHSPIGGALMVNTSYYYIIGSAHDEDALRKVRVDGDYGRVELDEYDIHRILHQKGKRDAYLVAPFYCGQIRFYPGKEFIAVASTDAEHKNILNAYRKKLGVDYITPQVIEMAKEEL